MKVWHWQFSVLFRNLAYIGLFSYKTTLFSIVLPQMWFFFFVYVFLFYVCLRMNIHKIYLLFL